MSGNIFVKKKIFVVQNPKKVEKQKRAKVGSPLALKFLTSNFDPDWSNIFGDMTTFRRQLLFEKRRNEQKQYAHIECRAQK